jgi:KDO2-lipid IV(A) lauroyltransferase
MIFIKLISKLPFRFLYLLSDLIYFLAWKIIGYRKKVVLQNLQNSFPAKTEPELHQIAAGFYKNLSDIMVESIKVLSMSKQQMQERVRVKNPEVMEAHLKAGRPVLGMASHQANWEWMLLGYSAQTEFGVDAVYKPLHNQFFDKLMLKIRSRFDACMVPDKQVFREMVKKRGQPRLLCMVGDQTPPPESRYWTRFLHQETAFFTGSDRMAKALNYVVIYAGIRRVRRGYYELEFQEIAVPPYEKESTAILDKYVAIVEKAIEKDPADWLWSHRRWKHRKPINTDQYSQDPA